MNLFLILLDDMFFAAIPAVGFALIFNVPPRALIYCAILGAIGHSFRTALLHFGTSLVLATLLASALVGFIGVQIAQRYLAHPKVFTVAAIIPMIPGIYAYKAMIAVVQINYYGSSHELFQQMMDNFVKTAFLLGALVFGLALPRLLFYRQKPVV
ncbi:threonine/serine exporter family protein [Actinobacillus porcinus]|uniref:threonine/serine exporter family protein n=1 Tax=Actinobacillus porcinus TaxID=51048 RepID=UPI002A911207|nr:threonine/serine exporter family protein [Actinobacillus porcinus]MDY6216815.1 threonine/serine exporter family protein [Actinobacillus porcinus]